MDPRLQEAIGSPRVRFQAADLTRLALAALDDLRRLDDGLYGRFVAIREQQQQPAAAISSLRELWDDTFRGLLQLLALCRVLGHPAEESAIVAEVDFGELGGLGLDSSDLELGANDIGDLLDGLGGLEDAAAPDREELEAQRWDKVLSTVASIEYGLRSQYTEAKDRFDYALTAGDQNSALGILDDACSAASEGAHALVAAVYEAFAPAIDTARVVPGYLTSLGRALLVRRGLAVLAAALAVPNTVLQRGDATKYPEALAATRAAMATFIAGSVCKAMRAADRWQIVQFECALTTEEPPAARMTSEGLVKYLESLGSINQREVLLVHDKRALDDMREALASARELMDLSPRTAKGLVDQAFAAALRLRGRQPASDELIAALDTEEGATLPTLALLERLDLVLAAAGA